MRAGGNASHPTFSGVPSFFDAGAAGSLEEAAGSLAPARFVRTREPMQQRRWLYTAAPRLFPLVMRSFYPCDQNFYPKIIEKLKKVGSITRDICFYKLRASPKLKRKT